MGQPNIEGSKCQSHTTRSRKREFDQPAQLIEPRPSRSGAVRTVLSFDYSQLAK